MFNPLIVAAVDDHEDWENGIADIGTFGRAVQFWSYAQNRKTTVEEAALVFNVAPSLMKLVIESHPWMEVEPDGEIYHEGE